MRGVFDFLFVFLDETSEFAGGVLPDVHVFTNVIGGLDVSNEECEGTVTVLGVHDTDGLGIASLILGVGNIVVLPVTLGGELSPVPHVSESFFLVFRHLHLLNDELLELVNLSSGKTNV